MDTYQIIDATGERWLKNRGVEYSYLQSRLQKALTSVGLGSITVRTVSPRAPNATDVRTTNSTDGTFLLAILVMGHKDLAKQLAAAANADRKSTDDLINEVFGPGPTRGLTWGRFSIVATGDLSAMDDRQSQATNRAYLSNLILHEAGHAVSGRMGSDVHSTGGVMALPIPIDDTERSLGGGFQNLLKKHTKRR